MTAHANARVPARLLMVLATAGMLMVALSIATPASAFIEDFGDDAVETQPDADAGVQHDAVDPGRDTTAPVGGVDAGFGGTAGNTGLGATHALAAALMAVTVGGHLVYARRRAVVVSA